MKLHYSLPVITLILVLMAGCSSGNTAEQPMEKPQVLIFTKTKGFRHESIEPGIAALQVYFDKHGIKTMHTEDTTMFTTEKLNDFDAVMFLLTTGNVLGPQEEAAFENYIRSGKGYVGVHSASDTEYDWPWYGQLVGAYFESHGDIQQASIDKTDTINIATQHLPARWQRTDEWYNFKQIPTEVDVLLKLDETTFQGGKHSADHPISWCKKFDGGRAFYTGMGHTVESFQDTMFLEHIRQGLMWTINKK